MKIVNTPKQWAFFRHTALNFLAIRQDAYEDLPCLAKNSLRLGISPIIKQALDCAVNKNDKMVLKEMGGPENGDRTASA